MATRDPDRAPPALGPFVRDGAAHLERLIARARPAPDFSAMLVRARELDPARVPAEAGAEAEAEAIAIASTRTRPEDRRDAERLAPFTAALRGQLDARLAERSMAGIPPWPPRRRARLGLGLVIAAAAAVLLVVFGPDLLTRQGGTHGVAAALESGGGDGDEVRPAVDREPLDPIAPATPADALPGPSLDPDPPPPAADTTPREHVPKARKKPHSPAAPAPSKPTPAAPAPSKPTPAAPGPSLEDQAQLLWQQGELVAAERKFIEIVELAGAGPRAELAYGDLFALARQIRGNDGQAAMWRQYLRRFPGGRFADDARAGLCRRDPGEACWRDYLEHHPTGAHRQQAEAALAAPPKAP